MTSAQPNLTDPDKLGLLIQCRQKMDELNTKDLYEYANSTLKSISIQQLKSVIFVGLNAIKNNISYNQLLQMKTSINEMIEQAKKLKNKSKPNTKQSESKSITNKSLIIPIIPKNASLTKTIPFDIISNQICQFLKMSSITQLAKCDRKLAIICHTPISINNLMHRYDIYPYAPNVNQSIMIDGYYSSIRISDPSNMHRFSNVEMLSIDLEYINTEDKIPLLNSFRRIKHLSFYDMQGCEICPIWDIKIQPMSLLQTISFINTTQTDNLIYFLNTYKNTNSITNNYYNQTIYQLTCIAFVDCNLLDLWTDYDEEDDKVFTNYPNIMNCILPSQPNRLQVLKLENSCFQKTTDDTQCDEANEEFENINRIKTSLANLKGFVYQQPIYAPNDLFFNLTRNILSNLTSFKYLESIHTHSLNNQLVSLYLNNNNATVLNKINEFCVSISMNQRSTRLLCDVKTLVPNLEKLCLVINISDNDASETSNFEKIIKSILMIKTLKLLQIVAICKDSNNIDPKFCAKKIKSVTAFTNILVKVFKKIRDPWYGVSNHLKRPLVFKFHVKSSHSEMKAKCKTYNEPSLEPFADSVQNMTMHYLMTFPVGKIQFKYSTNFNHHSVIRKLKTAMRGTDTLFRVITKEGGSLKHLQDNSDRICYSDMDFMQYAINVTQYRGNNCVEYTKNWKVHCRFCCNTPWV